MRNTRTPTIPDPTLQESQRTNFDWESAETVENLLLYFGAIPNRLVKYVAILPSALEVS